MALPLYSLYDAHAAMVAPTWATARATADLLEDVFPAARRHPVLRRMHAASRTIAGARLTHRRPSFDIAEISVPSGPLAVREALVDRSAFGSLVHFSVPGLEKRPKVLLVAALAGHFATLLAPTVRTLLRDHDVYVTDWHNARDVPTTQGRFGFDEYVDHVIRFLRVIGPDAHVVAVCQPCPATVAALALLAADPEPLHPRSLTLMAGPIDTRINPTKINELAFRRNVDWYRRNCVTTVPSRYAGAGRRVYPGFLQVSGLVSLNARRHLDSHLSIYKDLVGGRVDEARQTERFYAEYFAVLDVAAEFYLETIERVFMEHHLPTGQLRHHGRLVRPELIERTPLLTVEAERDDMCAVGQTAAAHALLPRLGARMRHRYVQPGVGHYGVFAGRRWDEEIYPVIRDFIRSNA